LTRLLHDFTASQKELFAQAEERLQEYKEKLMKVYQVREELHSHIQSLPDLSQLPDVSAGLPPLPSAGDLFSLR
jgi:regulator of Ty1 transposition protein 103